MIWITRSNVKFRIQGSRRVSSLKMTRDSVSGAKLDFNFMKYSPVNIKSTKYTLICHSYLHVCYSNLNVWHGLIISIFKSIIIWHDIMLSISLSTLNHSITNRTLRVTSGASQVLLAGVFAQPIDGVVSI